MQFIFLAMLLVLSACGRPPCDLTQIKMNSTAAEVVAACGEPNNKRVSNYGSGVEEQWAYGYQPFTDGAFIYFNNGRMTAWQLK